MKKSIAYSLAVALFVSHGGSTAFATGQMTQQQSVQVGITNVNSNKNTNSNSAKANASSSSKAQAQAVAKANGNGGGGVKKSSDARPSASANANSNAAAGSKSNSSAVTKTSSSSSSNNHNSINLKLGQQQSLSNSGNANLSNSGNSSLSNSGNSSSTSSMDNSGNSQSTVTDSGNSSSNSSVSNTGNSQISIGGDTFVNTYEAPKIPASSAAPSFATMCTQGIAGQTLRIGFSQSSITMQCKDLLDSFSQLEWMERVWNHINTNYANRLERADRIRTSLEAQKAQLEEAIAGVDLSKGGAELAALQAKLDICNKKLARLDEEEARMYAAVDNMAQQAEEAFGRSAVSIKNAHVSVRTKSSRVSTFLAGAAQTLFAPLGFIAILKNM